MVTTVQKADTMLREQAIRYAAELGCAYIERGKLSLERICAEQAVDTLVVARRNGPAVYTIHGELFFHLNMAQLRIKNLLSGGLDHMAQAMQLTRGLRVLDCTLGLGTDAVMSSYISGVAVTALESSPVVSLVIREGMRLFSAQDAAVRAALDRIVIQTVDYNEYLPKLSDKSYDIVYLDPMFRRPVKESCHLLPLRPVADGRCITPQALAEAVRVARRRVVIKETKHSGEFERLGITKLSGGKYSSVAYGVIECE